MNRESISVIIPTYNGASWLDSLLSSLFKQTRPPGEVILVDSASTDSTREIAGRYPVRLMVISANQFDHGTTRTMAARQAKGDILVFMTQDAIPVDQYALDRLVSPLEKNAELAASYGRQVADADAQYFSEHLRLFNYPEQSNERGWDDRLTIGFKTIFISNSFAAYRKSHLAEVGFFPEKLIFGEDSCTLGRLLQKGYRVRYVADAKVYHSHNYSILQDFRRYFDIGVLHASQSGMVSHFGTPTGAGKRFVRSEISFLLKKKAYIFLPESFIRNGFKFFAYALGKRYRQLPLPLARWLSMHHRWWG